MRYPMLALLILLSGCASTEMRTFVGKPVEETVFAYGQPENVMELPDGRRAYQYRWGGGSGVVPGRAVSAVSAAGNVATVTTTATPAMIFSSAGCLITFIARDAGRGYVVEEFRIPKQLVC